MLLPIPNEVFLFINKLESNKLLTDEMKRGLNTEASSEKSLCPSAHADVIHSS